VAVSSYNNGQQQHPVEYVDFGSPRRPGVLAASGKLLAVNIRTGKVQSLGIPLPKLSQLTIRSTAS
jgi:hypothetical protein